MPLDAAVIQDLIKKLNKDRDNYLKSVEQTHELLIQALRTAGGASLSPVQSAPGQITASIADAIQQQAEQPVASTSLSQQPTLQDTESLRRRAGSTVGGSTFEEEFEDAESLFIRTPLEPEFYDEDGLRNHIRTFPFTEPSRQILKGVVSNESLLQRKSLFPMELGELDDRSNYTHYSIFDVGDDGAPLPIKNVEGPVSRPIQIWRRIKTTNMDPQRRKAVGKIVIVREPSPLLFAALHYTMHKHFDVCHMYDLLYHDDPIISHPHHPFSDDHRRQRTFTVALEYFTIVGENCVPMQWQRYETGASSAVSIPLTRCSSVTALSLEGPPLSKLRNKDRQASKKWGNVYDPFSPWRVLSIQAYPDWKSSIDAHDGSKQYVNGPMAFMVTLRAEFCDAYKRLIGVYKAIADLVEPPANFIFDEKIRDDLLFEDETFTYSRRYFWAAQTLGIMNEDIRNIVDSYYDTFKDAVWSGTEKIVWPSGGFEVSPRHAHWRKKMHALRRDLEFEIGRLREVEQLNDKKMRFIKTLNDSLFSGTSVRESRHSVYLAGITVAQGDNIRLLTLVTILFLPLSFVTSVFGMTNLPQSTPFHNFAYVAIAVCIPFWILVGSLNSSKGMLFWKRNVNKLFRALAVSIANILFFFKYYPSWAQRRLGKGTKIQSLVPVRPSYRRSSSSNSVMEARARYSGMPNMTPQLTKTLANTGESTPEPAESSYPSIRPIPGTFTNNVGGSSEVGGTAAPGENSKEGAALTTVSTVDTLSNSSNVKFHIVRQQPQSQCPSPKMPGMAPIPAFFTSTPISPRGSNQSNLPITGKVSPTTGSGRHMKRFLDMSSEKLTDPPRYVFEEQPIVASAATAGAVSSDGDHDNANRGAAYPRESSMRRFVSSLLGGNKLRAGTATDQRQRQISAFSV